MGLIEREITEIRDIIKDYRKGNISAEQMGNLMSAYSQVEKRIGHELKAMALVSQFAKRNFNLPIEVGMIGKEVLPDAIEHAGDSQIVCPDQNLIITRRDCLTRSGSPEHFEQCRQCEHDKTTRRTLIPKLKSQE